MGHPVLLDLEVHLVSQEPLARKERRVCKVLWDPLALLALKAPEVHQVLLATQVHLVYPVDLAQSDTLEREASPVRLELQERLVLSV